MTDPVGRFSNRAENYAKYRPDYPDGVLELLRKECGLTSQSVVAEIGSGTGILTRHFLENGNRVFAVEPNEAMREFAESALTGFPGYVSVDGSAEATTLEDQSIDLVVAAQAFHWFDRSRSKIEFKRIVKSGGWVVLIWNERKLDSSPFLRDYEALLLKFGTDYEKVRHENVVSEIEEFFAPSPYRAATMENFQHFDFESFRGRVLSSSYTPPPGHPGFEPMQVSLRNLFEEHETNGTVTFEYETRIFYGKL